MICFSRSSSLRGSFLGDTSPGIKKQAGTISLLCSSASKQSHLWEAAQCCHWQPNLLMPNPKPQPPCGTALLRLASVPVWKSPPWGDQHRPLPIPHLHIRVLQEPHFYWGGHRSHFTGQPEHTYLKLTTIRPGTKHCSLQGRRASEGDWSETEQIQHTPETLPEATGPGNYIHTYNWLF